MSGLRDVSEGDALETALSADDWNRHNAATKWVEGIRNSRGGNVRPAFPADGSYRIKNAAGMSLPTYSVLGIDSPLFKPRDYYDAFRDEVILRGIVPDQDKHLSKFAILAEPLINDQTGRAWCTGICPCKIDPATATGATHAEMIDGDVSLLRGGSTGARILWLDDEDDFDLSGSGTGTGGMGWRWALIYLDGAPGDLLLKSAETTKVLGPISSAVGVFANNVYLQGKAFIADPVLQTWDDTRQVDVVTKQVGNALVLPDVDGSNPLAPQYVMWAEKRGDTYYAKSGGADCFRGKVVSFESGNIYQVDIIYPPGMIGHSIGCVSLWSEPLAEDQEVLIKMVAGMPSIIQASCVPPSTGTGTP